MRIKRVLQGTAVTAFAITAWLGAGSAGASAKVDITNVKFDEQNISLEVNFTESELMAGIATVDKNRKAKVKTWDVYEQDADNTGKAIIDLSKLNIVKDNYIAIMTNDMAEPLYVKLEATAKKNKITFHANTARISDFKSDSNNIEEIEYRRVTDSWSAECKGNINSLDFSEYQYQGATIYIRVPGTNALSKVTGTGADAYKDLINGQVDINTVKNASAIPVNVYNIGKLPGKEIKLNIAKQANGPSVPVDYKKGTVTVNKGLEYRIIKSDGIVSYSAIGSKSVKSVSELLESAKATSSGVIEVRKTAVTTGKGKSASKWTRVKIEKPKALALTGNTADINTATTTQAVTISTDSGAIIEAGYKLNSKNTVVTHLSLVNKTGDNYDYYTGSSVPKTGDKAIKTIKGGKTANIKKDDVSGKNIYIRMAGDKKARRWAGEWTQVGTGITVPEIALSK